MNSNKKELEELKMTMTGYSKEYEMKQKIKMESLEKTEEVQRYNNLSNQYKYLRERTEKHTDNYIYVPLEDTTNKHLMEQVVLEYCKRCCIVLQQIKKMECLPVIMEYKSTKFLLSIMQENLANNTSTSVQTSQGIKEYVHEDSSLEQPAVKKIGARAS